MVLFAARLIELLPMAALGGLLVMVGIEMFKPDRILVAWHTAWTPRAMMLVTFVATMMLPLQYAILLGVILHIVLLALRTADQVRIEQLIPDNGGFRTTAAPEVVPSHDVLVLQPIGGLFSPVPFNLPTSYPT